MPLWCDGRPDGPCIFNGTGSAGAAQTPKGGKCMWCRDPDEIAACWAKLEGKGAMVKSYRRLSNEVQAVALARLPPKDRPLLEYIARRGPLKPAQHDEDSGEDYPRSALFACHGLSMPVPAQHDEVSSGKDRSSSGKRSQDDSGRSGDGDWAEAQTPAQRRASKQGLSKKPAAAPASSGRSSGRPVPVVRHGRHVGSALGKRRQ